MPWTIGYRNGGMSAEVDMVQIVARASTERAVARAQHDIPPRMLSREESSGGSNEATYGHQALIHSKRCCCAVVRAPRPKRKRP
jgi:hypothetical protein